MNEVLKTILTAGAAAGVVIASTLQAVKARVKLPAWGCILSVAVAGAVSVLVSERYFGIALEWADRAVLWVVSVAASQGVYFTAMKESDVLITGEMDSYEDVGSAIEETENLTTEELPD